MCAFVISSRRWFIQRYLNWLPITWLTELCVCVELTGTHTEPCFLHAITLRVWRGSIRCPPCSWISSFLHPRPRFQSLSATTPPETHHFDSGVNKGLTMLQCVCMCIGLDPCICQSECVCFVLYQCHSGNTSPLLPVKSHKSPEPPQGRPGQRMGLYVCNSKPQYLTAYEHCPSAIDHASGSHCLVPRHQTVIWSPWRKREGMAGKEGTPITGRVINHNHIGSRMRQRQSWTTGQMDDGFVDGFGAPIL